MSNEPLLVTSSTAESLWQEYRVYEDRLEFRTLVGVLNVPFDRIEKVRVQQADIGKDVHAELTLLDSGPAHRPEWDDLVEHLVVDTRGGVLVKMLRLTPEDPVTFKKVIEDALAKYRAGMHPVV